MTVGLKQYLVLNNAVSSATKYLSAHTAYSIYPLFKKQTCSQLSCQAVNRH